MKYPLLATSTAIIIVASSVAGFEYCEKQYELSRSDLEKLWKPRLSHRLTRRDKFIKKQIHKVTNIIGDIYTSGRGCFSENDVRQYCKLHWLPETLLSLMTRLSGRKDGSKIESAKDREIAVKHARIDALLQNMMGITGCDLEKKKAEEEKRKAEEKKKKEEERKKKVQEEKKKAEEEKKKAEERKKKAEEEKKKKAKEGKKSKARKESEDESEGEGETKDAKGEEDQEEDETEELETQKEKKKEEVEAGVPEGDSAGTKDGRKDSESDADVTAGVDADDSTGAGAGAGASGATDTKEGEEPTQGEDDQEEEETEEEEEEEAKKSDCDYTSFEASHTMLLPPSDCVITKVGLEEGDKEYILKLHNERRSKIARGGEELRGKPGPQPPAANMRELVWNDQLAEVAEAWAKQCNQYHDTHGARKICSNNYNVGQNLYFAYTYVPDVDWQKAVDNWYEEVKSMPVEVVSSYRKIPKPDNVGHYTQVVWADTYEVGCGIVHYETTVQGQFFPRSKLYACNYGPSGNIKTLPVYLEGPAASQCPNGISKNYPDLCA